MDDRASESFFFELLLDTEKQFKKSPISQKQLALGRKWNYAICATPIVRAKGVIFGINWAGEDGYEPQSVMPTGQGITKYHFIQQGKHFFEKYLEIDFGSINFNYTNLCFFRSPKEKDLSVEDYKLSLPLFEKYVHYINPPWILSIGGTNLKMLDSFGLLRNLQRHFDDQNRFKGHSAHIWEYNIYSVPHPSAQLTSDARHTIWTKVTKEMKKATNR